MIVTSKFDVALEQAFLLAGEPFDVAIYMTPGTECEGKSVHLPWGKVDPRPVLTPIEYDRFPFVRDYGELTRTIIVRVNGAIDDLAVGYRWKGNLMITEDHYLDYLRHGPAEETVPMHILAKLREASCLFIGYPVANWRYKAFPHLIWDQGRPSGPMHWAIERDPDILEQQSWRQAGIGMYKSTSTEYVKGIDRFLDHPS
jgi:hypothetical protein